MQHAFTKPAGRRPSTCPQQPAACRPEDKLGALTWLCQEVLGAEEQSLVFTATRHHTELVAALLAAQGVSCACVYGAMDQVRSPLPMRQTGARLRARPARRACGVMVCWLQWPAMQKAWEPRMQLSAARRLPWSGLALPGAYGCQPQQAPATLLHCTQRQFDLHGLLQASHAATSFIQGSHVRWD